MSGSVRSVVLVHCSEPGCRSVCYATALLEQHRGDKTVVPHDVRPMHVEDQATWIETAAGGFFCAQHQDSAYAVLAQET